MFKMLQISAKTLSAHAPDKYVEKERSTKAEHRAEHDLPANPKQPQPKQLLQHGTPVGRNNECIQKPHDCRQHANTISTSDAQGWASECLVVKITNDSLTGLAQDVL